MFHDFKSNRANKYTSTRELCTGVGGYMDYQPSPNIWSACSVEDFEKYYNHLDKWCLTSRKI